MDNRETILETALDLFYTRGYDAVGVQEIAERSGVTKPTLYYYFKSKYGLLEQLLTSRSEAFAAELREACAYRGDLKNQQTVSHCFRHRLPLVLVQRSLRGLFYL